MEKNYYLQYFAFRKWKEKSSGTIVNYLQYFTFGTGKEKLLKNLGEFNLLNATAEWLYLVFCLFPKILMTIQEAQNQISAMVSYI